MLKLGFSLKSYPANNQIKEIIESTNCQLAGVWLDDGLSNIVSYDHNIHKGFEELLNSCDFLIIACSSNLKFDITSRTIKKGVVPILNNIEGLTTSMLNELHLLAIEMGIKVGVANLGYNFSDSSLPTDAPFIAHLNRVLPNTILNNETFQAIITNDLAAALKISKHNIRKIRAYGLPLNTNIPKNLMVLIDFNNNSVLTYSLSTNDREDSFSLEVITDNNSANIHFVDNKPCQEILQDEFNVDSLIDCIEKTVKDVDHPNNIDLALGASRIVDIILSKIKS